MKTLNLWITILCLFYFSLSFAQNESAREGGNGGSILTIEVKLLAFELADELSKTQTKIDLEAFKELIYKSEIEPTNEQLYIKGKPVDAINYPLKKKIVINIQAWDKASLTVRKILVHHEYMGLMDPSDKDFGISLRTFNKKNLPSGSNLLKVKIGNLHAVFYRTTVIYKDFKNPKESEVTKGIVAQDTYLNTEDGKINFKKDTTLEIKNGKYLYGTLAQDTKLKPYEEHALIYFLGDNEVKLTFTGFVRYGRVNGFATIQIHPSHFLRIKLTNTKYGHRGIAFHDNGAVSSAQVYKYDYTLIHEAMLAVHKNISFYSNGNVKEAHILLWNEYTNVPAYNIQYVNINGHPVPLFGKVECYENGNLIGLSAKWGFKGKNLIYAKDSNGKIVSKALDLNNLFEDGYKLRIINNAGNRVFIDVKDRNTEYDIFYKNIRMLGAFIKLNKDASIEWLTGKL